MQHSSKPLSQFLAIPLLAGIAVLGGAGSQPRPAGSRGPRASRDHRPGPRARDLGRGEGLRDALPARDDPAGPAVRPGRRGHRRRDAALPSGTLPRRPVQPADGQERRTDRRARPERAGEALGGIPGRDRRPGEAGGARAGSRGERDQSSTKSWSAGSRPNCTGCGTFGAAPATSFRSSPGRGGSRCAGGSTTP